MTNAEFTEFVERYQRYVFTICFQLVRDRGEAQNLAQEAFLSAYRHIDSCAPEHYRPWLARIAANKAKDALKSAYHRRVQAPGDEEMDRLPAGKTPEELFDSQEAAQAARREILALREPYHEVARMYFLEERSVDEIAAALGRPKKTVQTQIYRARIQLRERLQEVEP